jgi:tripeptidyl-peptidase-1
MAYPIHSTFYSTGGRPPFKKDANTPENDSEPCKSTRPHGPLTLNGDIDLNFLNYMLAQKSLPSVISTSYGDDEQTVPLSYAKKVCALYAQLGARGVTVLHSSGDGGATGAFASMLTLKS